MARSAPATDGLRQWRLGLVYGIASFGYEPQSDDRAEIYTIS